MKSDPAEQKNLLIDGQEISEEFRRIYDEYKAQCAAAEPLLQIPKQDGGAGPSEDMEEEMKALGYL